MNADVRIPRSQEMINRDANDRSIEIDSELLVRLGLTDGRSLRCSTLALVAADSTCDLTSTAMTIADPVRKAGGRVLIVDANECRPQLHKKVKQPSGPGLAGILCSGEQPIEAISECASYGLDILPFGSGKAFKDNPDVADEFADLLNHFVDEYHLVVVCGAPMGTFVSSHLWLEHAGSLVLVLPAKIRLQAAKKVKSNLRRAKLRPVGALVVEGSDE